MRIRIYNGRPAANAASEAEIERLLALAAEAAKAAGRLNLVTLETDRGDMLSLVVGGEESVLGFTYAHRSPKHFASKGPAKEDEPVLTAFAGLQDHIEFPRSRVIPSVTAIGAAREFFRTKMLPQGVLWSET